MKENECSIQEWISNPTKTGDHLWQELGKTFCIERETKICPKEVRRALENTLFQEQNGLCCYCGNKLERDRFKAIEHFEAKSKIKGKVFDYSNLMLCCKESQRLISFEVGRTYNGLQVNGVTEVQKLTSLSKATIVEFDKNKHLLNGEILPGVFIHVPNPPHCDDEKSKHDNNTNQAIINPTINKELIDQLQFHASGEVDYLGRENNTNEIIENTIRVLALNCITLVDRRREKWENAFVNYFDESTGIIPHWVNEFSEKNLNESEMRDFLTINLQKILNPKLNLMKMDFLNLSILLR
ncbi:MAG: TIGR02646 family protein [Saprospirales bacterium]|nr:TIGR02646 family protein [Saprospirales bacterium]